MTFTVLFLTTEAERFAAPLRARVKGVSILAAKTLHEALPYADAVDAIVSIGDIPDDALCHFPKLRWVQALTTGTDHFLPKLRKLPRPVYFTSARGVHGSAVSELAVLLMLALARRLPDMMRNQARHRYERVVGSLLCDKTVAVAGVGVIGLQIIEKCKAFGMKTIGFGSELRDCPTADSFYSYDRLAEIVPDVDFLVLVAALNQRTRGMIDARVFSMMKRGSWFVNVGRGATVDEDALIAALREGQIAGAGLDAMAIEPLPDSSPLWDMEQVIVTPHMGGDSDDFPARLAGMVETNLRLMIENKPDRLINPVAYQPSLR